MITREVVQSYYPVKELGELADFLDNRRRPVKESDRAPGPYPYFGANGQQGTIDGYLFDEPLILLAEDGGFFDDPDRGIAYRISGKSWVNNHAHVVRAKNGNADLGYLHRVLENYDVRPFISGTTRGKLTKGQAERILIPIPPLNEQRRIAAILDKADALRCKHKGALKFFDDLNQSIFLAMFGDPTTNPKNFPRSTLESIVTAVVDCPHTTPNWTSSGKIALRTSNLTAGGWDWSDTRFVSKKEFRERSFRAFVKPGDIVLSREGTVGVAAIVPNDLEVCLGQRLVQIRLEGAPISGQYLLAFLLYELAPKRISRIMVGATSTHLNLKDLRKMQVPLPPKSLQAIYQRKANLIHRLKERASAASAEIDHLFSSLQSRAFSGQL